MTHNPIKVPFPFLSSLRAIYHSNPVCSEPVQFTMVHKKETNLPQIVGALFPTKNVQLRSTLSEMSKTTTKSSVNCNRAYWHLKISLSIIFSCLVQPTTIICSLGFKLKNFPKLSLFLVDFISHNLGLLVKGSHLNIRGGNVFFRVIF